MDYVNQFLVKINQIMLILGLVTKQVTIENLSQT
jgi:hypothetical protein